MQPTSEIQAFIDRINALPAGLGVSLDAALQPSLDEEADLRKFFATDKKNTRLSNPYVGLVDVFEAPATIRTTRTRVVEGIDDLSAKYVMPIADSNRRHEGVPSTVADLEEFKKNWFIFTEGSLSQLINWNNVVAAGGSVLACLLPIPNGDKATKRTLRTYFHTKAYPTSDVDLFLWGLTPEQAEQKIKEIYEAVRDSVPWDVTCIRTKHTVSIHSQYPYRSVQIVLRLYQSPAEILAGFDIDAPSCAYDGKRVWANPRAIVAMMRQCNTVDMTRRSPSYEVRLAKYSQRHFEVYVPTLERSKVDPTIYERSIARLEGLARLLALEKLANDNMRNTFLEARRQLRGRTLANALTRRRRGTKRKYKGDIKGGRDSGVVEVNDYDVASLHLPYGPGWDAKRIDKLVYQTDLGMNSTFNPKNKGRRLHRHPAFFGTIDECIEDCCGNCPKPIDDDERKLQAEEDEVYIRGRIQFIEENPGRQSMTGSFKPIDVGEWSDQVYIKPTHELFTAIATHDRATVQRLISEEKVDINERDHVGRTSLHVAILSQATDIAIDLIEAGARITARISDGKAPLHLAAQSDMVDVIKKLLERSAKNKEEMESKSGEARDDDTMGAQDVVEKPSSEDDWSSHDDEDVVMSDASDEFDDHEDSEEENRSDKVSSADKDVDSEAAQEDVQEEAEEEDQPDIIDVNEVDWDFGFSALSYAVLFASVPTIETLLSAGADLKLTSKSAHGQPPLHPLTLTILREDQDEACLVAECLLKAGATSSTADDNMRTIFHAAVIAGRTSLVETMLRCDPHASTVINFPMFNNYRRNVAFPIASAISLRHYGIVALLLAHDAKLELDERDVSRATAAASPNVIRELNGYRSNEITNYLQLAYQPVELALKNHDDLAKLLISLGASVDFGILEACGIHADASSRRTIKEWVDLAVLSLETQISKKKDEMAVIEDVAMDEPQDEERQGWIGFYRKQLHAQVQLKTDLPWQIRQKVREARSNKETLEQLEDIKEFFVEIQALLTAKGAKGWQELYPDVVTEASTSLGIADIRRQLLGYHQTDKSSGSAKRTVTYMVMHDGHYSRTYQPVAQHLLPAYDELFEACYNGDSSTIQRLCLPSEGQDTTTSLLNISVRAVDSSIDPYDHYGYTPLTAAIEGRRWSTAKVILAVATAQYHPHDKKDRIRFDLNIKLDDDDESDNESDASGDSDITVEQEVNFVDIATRKSTVQSNVHPKVMLSEVEIEWIYQSTSEGEKPYSLRSLPLDKAVVERDFDSFKHIIDLYQSLAQPLEISNKTLDVVLNHDQVEMLDEFIRRTGGGLDISAIKTSSTSEKGEGFLPPAINDTNKMYLGLDVHGKKRMDLAQKNDPDALDEDDQGKRVIPLLWQAIQSGAESTIEYLRSDRPLAAYQAYIAQASHGDEKGRWLKHFLFGGKTRMEQVSVAMRADAKKRLSGMLGWEVNSLGESPLAAALISNSVKMIELMENLEPDLAAKALNTKIKFVGINYLVFAVEADCPVDVIDYLLAKNVSAVECSTHRGWNIYHYLSSQNNRELFEHFLHKLPRDVNEELLKQPSKGRHNTPLHIAIKKGHIELVSIILGYTSDVATHLQMRDAHGETAIHAAVRTGRAAMTKFILDLAGTIPSPSASAGVEMMLQHDLLKTEDSVGLTPLEISRGAELITRVRGSVHFNDGVSSGALHPNMEPEVLPRRVVVERAETEEEKQRNGRGKERVLQMRVLGSMVHVRAEEKETHENVEEVKKILSRLEAEGKTRVGLDVSKVKTWIGEMDKLVAREKERELKRGEKIQKEEAENEKRERKERNGKEERRDPETEVWNEMATHRVLEDFAARHRTQMGAGAGRRHLVHLLDVQRSVHATLAKASSAEDAAREDYSNPDNEGGYPYGGRYRRVHRRISKYGAEGELEKEDDAEEEERRQRKMSIVFQYIALGPDTL